MTLGEVPETLADVSEQAELFEQNDLAVSIDRLEEACERAESEADIDIDGITLPFYEDDRALAFVMGLQAGAVMEKQYADDESGKE